MNVLFIGGTGNISSLCTQMAENYGIRLTLLTRSQTERRPVSKAVERIIGNADDAAELDKMIGKRTWDCVVDWRLFTPSQAERALDTWRNRTGQFIFISSASVYCTPPNHPVITEGTPLGNPFWEYSRNKIACEEILLNAWREETFPVTIVRPSHTYDTVIPVAAGHWDYSVVERMKAGKPMIVPGDGTSLWTLTHARDFARGFLPLIGHPRAVGEAIHITSDESLTWNQIMGTIARVFECQPRLLHIPSEIIARLDPEHLGPSLLGDKAYSVIFDNSKLKRLVPGFCASIPFHAGMKETQQWFDEDASRRQTDDHGRKIDALQDHIVESWSQAVNHLPE